MLEHYIIRGAHDKRRAGILMPAEVLAFEGALLVCVQGWKKKYDDWVDLSSVKKYDKSLLRSGTPNMEKPSGNGLGKEGLPQRKRRLGDFRKGEEPTLPATGEKVGWLHFSLLWKYWVWLLLGCVDRSVHLAHPALQRAFFPGHISGFMLRGGRHLACGALLFLPRLFSPTLGVGRERDGGGFREN
jgi:hypothetical protein